MDTSAELGAFISILIAGVDLPGARLLIPYTLPSRQPSPRRSGRPPGSGRYFSTGKEFEAALRKAMSHVHSYEPPISKTKVAARFRFRTSIRQLNRFLKDFGVNWDETRASIESSIRP